MPLRQARGRGVRSLCLWGTLCTACLVTSAARADEPSPWYLSLYAGRYSDQHLYEDILGQKPLRFENAWLVTAAVTHPISAGPRHRWEVEAQAGKYAGAQTEWEFNGLVIWRWSDFPWNRRLATTAALGEGMSYDTEIPPLELASHTNTGTQRVLNYFMLEATFGPPDADWALLMRVHHRSGVFGLYGGVHGGSNVIAVGVKIGF